MLLEAADIADQLDIPELDSAELERRLPPAYVVYDVGLGIRTPLWDQKDVARVYGDTA